MHLKTWSLQNWGVNTLSCLQYKNIIVDKNQSIPYFPPHCGIQCSIPSKVCPLRKRLPLSCHKNSSQIFDATKLWKHTIPLTYNTETLISNISETHRFSPQMRLIAYPDHKTTHVHKEFFLADGTMSRMPRKRDNQKIGDRVGSCSVSFLIHSA